MKKALFRRRSTLIPRRVTVPTAIVGAVVIVLLLLRFVAPGALTWVGWPVWKVGGWLGEGARSATAFFTGPATLRRELDSITVENQSLQNQNATLAAELTDLQKLLGTRTAPPPGILAGVLARPPESPYDTLLLDEGSNAGVFVGALVLGQGGAPIGKIASVTKSSSRALLFSQSGVTTNAWAGNNRIAITLTGVGAGAYESTASKESNLIVGDLVYVADGGAAAVGRIARIDTDPSSGTVTLRIQPLVNLFSTTWVTIVSL